MQRSAIKGNGTGGQCVCIERQLRLHLVPSLAGELKVAKNGLAVDGGIGDGTVENSSERATGGGSECRQELGSGLEIREHKDGREFIYVGRGQVQPQLGIRHSGEGDVSGWQFDMRIAESDLA